MPSIETRRGAECLFDAGLFIGALLTGDPRHEEALPVVEDAYAGRIRACTTSGILSEVYAALTWHQAQPPQSPEQAAYAVLALVEPPSAIRILNDTVDVAVRTMLLAARHGLTARRVHDARHAATALVAGVFDIYTYDAADWTMFGSDGLRVAGPPSTLTRLAYPSS